MDGVWKMSMVKVKQGFMHKEGSGVEMVMVIGVGSNSGSGK